MKTLIMVLVLSTISMLSLGQNFETTVNNISNSSTVNLRVKPDNDSEILCKLKHGEKIKLTGKHVFIYFEVIYNGQLGYIMEDFIKRTSKVQDIINNNKQYNDSIESKKKEASTLKYKDNLISIYGPAIASRILRNEIWIGMTSSMAYDSWGYPTRSIRHENSNYRTEMCVYEQKNTYLHFTNGILEGISTN